MKGSLTPPADLTERAREALKEYAGAWVVRDYGRDYLLDRVVAALDANAAAARAKAIEESISGKSRWNDGGA